MSKTQQEKVEEILKDEPKMARNDLMRIYIQLHTNYTTEEREKFLIMMQDVAVENILRYARKYRQKLGIRDEVRQKLAEQERRYWPTQKNLEPNPPKVEEKVNLKDYKQPFLLNV